MLRSSIIPELLQDMLDSAPNALAKGQAQYFTPPGWAALLAEPLPGHRSAIVDLACGAGALLHGAALHRTEHLLGCDIDSAWRRPHAAVPGGTGTELKPTYIQADITSLYSTLLEVDFRADLFVLNPPYDLHWSRERLAGLRSSHLNSVRAAVAAHDGRTGRATIDSTVATLCMALDRCSAYGEGYCIANAGTVNRLLLDRDAPHRAISKHLWAILTIDGNICIPGRVTNRDIQTAVLYFGVSHEDGPQFTEHASDLEQARHLVERMRRNRLSLRRGCEVRSYTATEDTVPKWIAIREELKSRAKPGPERFNLWLDVTGHIATHLSLFLEHSVKVDKAAVADLHSLRGKRPAQLVLLRDTRDTLMRCCGLDQAESLPWRASPDLIAAVQCAVRDYHNDRTPIVPLPPIQRLGYLDEESTIRCLAPLSHLFTQGHIYPLSARTVKVTRSGLKWNMEGGQDKVEYTGQELAFFITAGGREWCFMEGRLRADGIALHEASKAGWTEPPRQAGDPDGIPAAAFIDFTLAELAEHFHIPDVPDIAAVRPSEYQANLEAIDALERLLSA